jgi:hypothetical protein
MFMRVNVEVRPPAAPTTKAVGQCSPLGCVDEMACRSGSSTLRWSEFLKIAILVSAVRPAAGRNQRAGIEDVACDDVRVAADI